MLGTQGFTSGRHHWEVEVGNNTNWAVGVATQSVQRKKQTKLSRAEGILALRFMNSRYTTETRPVSVLNKLQKVRVALDWKRGEVTFSDPARNHHIDTIKFKFTEPVFPYFYSLCKKHPLNITPEKVSIAIGPPKRGVFLLIFFLILLILYLFYVLLCCMIKDVNNQMAIMNQSM
ncbi:hypothetical protein SKAU_G00117370 [Synaphobranchus kaupii]|uniref:B30.2/SPRY domain-containing protein n=1 Tax=Synaphobranchus kaupii TaxID=118154 RepID=A0A9Q1FMV4_SYNKA|nr:hypothetical protein SKAU_G00117370 [Synaphobranchus kaupii]